MGGRSKRLWSLSALRWVVGMVVLPVEVRLVGIGGRRVRVGWGKEGGRDINLISIAHHDFKGFVALYKKIKASSPERPING